jgi:rRNA maturation RNase YbeY
MGAINFFSEQIDFALKNERHISEWVINVIAEESKELGAINYIFCTDKYLLKINKEYLDHDEFTDVITFQDEEANNISGDIFISIDRVSENSQMFDVNFEDELSRVMIHGVLHLVGYGDKSADEIKVMRQKEESCLKLLSVSRET